MSILDQFGPNFLKSRVQIFFRENCLVRFLPLMGGPNIDAKNQENP